MPIPPADVSISGPAVSPALPACPQRRGWKATLWNWCVSFGVALAVLTPLRSAVADWNDVPSGSMEPTILPGDRIWVNKLAYGLRVPLTYRWVIQWDEPAPGEIVVLHSPADGQRLVKRLIAGPGDTVAMINNVLIINGRPLAYSSLPESALEEVPRSVQTGRRFAQERLGDRSHAVAAIPSLAPAAGRRNFGPVTVPEGHYFVMGDNRDNSADSRHFGFVPRHRIVGRSSAVAISVDPDRYYLPRFGRWFMGLR